MAAHEQRVCAAQAAAAEIAQRAKLRGKLFERRSLF